MSAGVVSSVTVSATAGLAVELSHADGYRSRYFHLESWAPGLTEGGRVAVGDVIGFVGSSGRATGPHLHFELEHNGVPIDAGGLLPAPAERLPRRAMRAHHALLRRLIGAQLEDPTAPRSWGPTTVSAPPVVLGVEPTVPSGPQLSAEEERIREAAELEAQERADARARAAAEEEALAEAEREARELAGALADEEAILREEREREARELARVAAEAEAEARADAEAAAREAAGDAP